MYIGVDEIITAAAVFTALATIAGALAAVYKFVDRQKKQDCEIKLLRREQQILCRGQLAILQTLEAQCTNGEKANISKAKTELERHINEIAHGASDEC